MNQQFRIARSLLLTRPVVENVSMGFIYTVKVDVLKKLRDEAQTKIWHIESGDGKHVKL